MKIVKKFRGQRKDTKEWVYGDLIHYRKDDYRILDQNEGLWDIFEAGYEVIPESVGQYIGFSDDDGVEIYEGDELRIYASDYEGNDHCYESTIDDIVDYVNINYSNGVYVIGNKFDNKII